MEDPIRLHLLKGVRQFVESASQVEGVLKIAMIGSLTTEKVNPKDADVLVTIDKDVDIDRLAMFGRKLKGHGQHRNLGADIFLCNVEGEYLGRTCSFRECHFRVRCQGSRCDEGTRIQDDFENLRLDKQTILNPPLELWPTLAKRRPVPSDVEEFFFQVPTQ